MNRRDENEKISQGPKQIKFLISVSLEVKPVGKGKKMLGQNPLGIYSFSKFVMAVPHRPVGKPFKLILFNLGYH
jgi:hypothetical protein